MEESARVRNSHPSHRYSVPSKCGDEFAPASACASAIFLQLHVFKSVRTRLGAPKGFPLVDVSDERMGCYGTCGCAPFLRFSGDFGCVVVVAWLRGFFLLELCLTLWALCWGAQQKARAISPFRTFPPG